MKNVLEILKQWLIDNGYDGLYCPHEDCGCDLDDLHACDENFSACKPGYKKDTLDDDEYDYRICSKK